MAYLQELSNQHKALFILLLDQSGSMNEPMQGLAKSRAEVLAEAVNAFLAHLLSRAVKDDGMDDWCDIVVIGYRTDEAGEPIVESAFCEGFVDDQVVPVASLIPRIEARDWVEAKAEGGTPTCSAFMKAWGIIKHWISSHPQSFPPVVCNFTDGEPTEDDLNSFAEMLEYLHTEDGNVLLLNCLLSSHSSSEPELFPSNEATLHGEFERHLFQLSSTVPDDLPTAITASMSSAEEGQYAIEPGSKLCVIGADELAVTSSFKFLTDLIESQYCARVTPGLEPLTQQSSTSTSFTAQEPAFSIPAAPDVAATVVDENVQFTVYRPKTVKPNKWYPLLAFAHLDELPDDADEDELDPVEEVQRQAERVLGDKVRQYKETTQDSSHAVPKEGEIILVPEVDGCEFNPPRQSFRWVENVHRAEFRMRADSSLDGSTARGRLSVFLGAILLADVPLRFKVDSSHQEIQEEVATESTTTQPYRKIFASYSHKDLAIVQQFERYAETLGDRYLRDWKELRSGENWSDRLLEMIDEADVFQLFWSTNSMSSPYVRQEWEHALSLKNKGPNFIRPTYWESPFPERPTEALPPPELRLRHFTALAAPPTSHTVLNEAPEVSAGSVVNSDGVAEADESDLVAPLTTDVSPESAEELMTAADSGLSLDEPTDLTGETDMSLENVDDDDVVAMEDEFLMSGDDSIDSLDSAESWDQDPSVSWDEDEDDDAGSQVIALDDSESFNPDAAAMLSEDNDLCMEMADDDMDVFAPMPSVAGCAMPSMAATPRRSLRSRLLIFGIAGALLVVAATGIVYFLGQRGKNIKAGAHADQLGRLLEQDRLDEAQLYVTKVRKDEPAILEHELVLPVTRRLEELLVEKANLEEARLTKFEGVMAGLESTDPWEIDTAELSLARSLAETEQETARLQEVEQKSATYANANRSVIGTLTEAIGDLKAFETAMRKYTDEFSGSPRSEDLLETLTDDLPLLADVELWNELLDSWTATDARTLSPAKATDILKSAKSLAQKFPGLSQANVVEQRIASLEAIARRVSDDAEPLTTQLIKNFQQPVASLAFVLQTKQGRRYYTATPPRRQSDGFYVDFAIDSELNTKQAVIATDEVDLIGSGRLNHVALAKEAISTLEEVSDEQWEASFFRLARSIRSATNIDPALQLRWLYDVVKVGCAGSEPLRSAFNDTLSQLTEADQYLSIDAWDPESEQSSATRRQCEEMLADLPDFAAVGVAAAQAFRELESFKARTRVTWAGFLFRNEVDQWQFAYDRARQLEQSDLFLLSTDDASQQVTREQIGTITSDQATLLPEKVGFFSEGRPVYAETPRRP